MDTQNIDSMKVADLREALKGRDLDTKGNKAELIERLKEALGEQEDGNVENGNSEEVEDSNEAPVEDEVTVQPVEEEPEQMEAQSDEQVETPAEQTPLEADPEQVTDEPGQEDGAPQVESNQDDQQQSIQSMSSYPPAQEAGATTENGAQIQTFPHQQVIRTGQTGNSKVFAGGLSPDTSAEDLRAHFAKYADVADVILKTDPMTGRSRGFAFVTFVEVDGASKAMAPSADHMVNGKRVDVKPAERRQDTSSKKVFVGGVDDETMTEESLRENFTKYGEVESIDWPKEKGSEKQRQFCFITFTTIEAAKECMNAGKQDCCGKQVDVHTATPKPGEGGYQQGGGRGGRGGFNNRGGRGGGGGSWGGYNNGQGDQYGGGYQAQQGGWGQYPGYPQQQSWGQYPGYDYYGQYGQQGAYPQYDYSQYNQQYQQYAQQQPGAAQPDPAAAAQQSYDYSQWYEQYGQQAQAAAGQEKSRGGARAHPYQRT